MTEKPEATELEYLRWFRVNADFGPSDGEVKYIMDKEFEKETGKKVPRNWHSE